LIIRAFLDPYVQYPRFSDGAGMVDLEEFLDAKDVVTRLSKEYEACERADYVSPTRFTHGLLALSSVPALSCVSSGFVCCIIQLHQLKQTWCCWMAQD